jgi:hypothetical protein
MHIGGPMSTEDVRQCEVPQAEAKQAEETSRVLSSRLRSKWGVFVGLRRWLGWGGSSARKQEADPSLRSG